MMSWPASSSSGPTNPTTFNKRTMSNDTIEVIAPLPEAIDGEIWHVSAGPTSRVDHESHQMFVPLTAAPEDHYLRLHEQAHAKWTPDATRVRKASAEAKIHPDTIMTVEDARVHSLLRMAGLGGRLTGTRTVAESILLARRAIRQPNMVNVLAHALTSAAFTGDYRRLIDALTLISKNQGGVYPPDEQRRAEHVLSHVPELVNNVVNSLHRQARIKGPSFEDTVDAAKLLRDLVATVPPEPEKPEEMDEDGQKLADISEKETEIAKKYLQQLLQNSGVRKDGDGKSEWGDLNIITPAATETIQSALMSRRPRPTDTGAVPRYMHRMYIDGRVFGQRKKSPGGTVLIDSSGSMSFSDQDIEEIITNAPSATIAMYSGQGAAGRLTIIARNGHRCSQETVSRMRQEAGGGNIVDGPALAWLAKQEEPRIWVCDGVVTGKYESQTPQLAIEAYTIANQNRIRRFGSIVSVSMAIRQMVRGRRVRDDGLLTVRDMYNSRR